MTSVEDFICGACAEDDRPMEGTCKVCGVDVCVFCMEYDSVCAPCTADTDDDEPLDYDDEL